MDISKNQKIIGGVVIAAVVAYFVYKHMNKSKNVPAMYSATT